MTTPAYTAEEWQARIVAEFGNTNVATNITIYWATAAQGYTDLTQIYLATKIYIIDQALIGAIGKVDFRALNGASVSQSDMFDHLVRLRELWASQLAAAAAGAAGGAAVGLLQQTAPVMPPCQLGPDANDRAYRGDTYRGRRRWPR